MLVFTALLALQTGTPGTSPLPIDSLALRHANGRVPGAVTAVRVPRAPDVDGRLDDPAWAAAVPVGGFRQIDPHEGAAASESTTVMLVYTDDAIYVGARLWDSEPAKIDHRLGRRDDFSASDEFFVDFDSYHDHRTAFEFAVNPAGVKLDDITSNDFFFGDRSWDPVWDVATRIDSLGWTVEMRIPFSQLRFPQVRDQLWGVQFFRQVFRKNEFSQLEFKTKTETGYASRFAHLMGLRDIPAPRRLEVLPYGVGRGTHDAGQPPGAAASYFGGAGLDVKYGVTSNFTLDATVNPDFGQVEADPAFVNLSAFEQFFEERRPFFVEGANIFEFGGGSGFIHFGGTPQWFYSRRIGQPPFGEYTSAAVPGSFVFDSLPRSTTILAAGKLTGKTPSGWALGLLNAVTATEHAPYIDTSGVRSEPVAQPLTNYFVVRGKRELKGTTGVGFLGSAVLRDVVASSYNYLRTAAYAAAGDFFHRWDNNAYSLTGSVGVSHVAGNTLAIQDAQVASSRYFQRPDSRHLRYDPTRTSLTGISADVAINKEGGATNWAFGASTTTPGFEINDIGFQTRVDRISAATFLGHQWTKPGRVFRQASVSVSGGPSWNYDGDLIGMRVGAFNFGQFLNYWGYNFNIGYGFRSIDDRLTRGGPLAETPAEFNIGGGFFSDGRKPVNVGAFSFYSRDASGAWFLNVNPNLTIRPSGAIRLNLGPGYFVGRSTAQFVVPVPDPTAVATFGTRYVFADLDQHSVDVSVRVNWTLSPTLSFQLYAQPFTFSGDYAGFKELAAPRSFDFNRYGLDNASTLTVASTDSRGHATAYQIDPSGAPGDTVFLVSNPDFRTRSLQSNAVLRWEYRPGSTLFLVWTQNRSGFAPYDASFNASRDLGDLLLFRRHQPTNVLLVKVNYWLSL